jgi:putative membrane protein
MLVNMTLLIRWLLLACALVLLTQWDLGVQVDNFGAAMWAALVIGLLNAFVRPLLILLTLPVTLLTLGLFLFVINALTFQMASGLLDGFPRDRVLAGPAGLRALQPVRAGHRHGAAAHDGASAQGLTPAASGLDGIVTAAFMRRPS